MKKVGRILIQAQRIIGILLALSAALIIVVQVLLRYVFKAPLMGIEELLTFFTIWLYMLGASNASQTQTHIECGILTLYIKKERTTLIYEFIKSTLCVVIGAWATYWMYVYMTYCLKKWQYSTILKIPMFIGQCALFVGVLLMLLFALRDLYVSVKNLAAFGRKSSGKEDMTGCN